MSKCTRACITDKLDHSNTAIPFPLHFDDCELPGPLCHQPNLPRRSSPRPARSAGAQQSVCAQLNACAAADRQPTSACFPGRDLTALRAVISYRANHHHTQPLQRSGQRSHAATRRSIHDAGRDQGEETALTGPITTVQARGARAVGRAEYPVTASLGWLARVGLGGWAHPAQMSGPGPCSFPEGA